MPFARCVGLCLLAVVLTCSVAVSQGARSGLYRVTLTATPRQVPADGQTAARLRIDVRDQGGRAAPDGTQVVVRTELGWVNAGGGEGRQNSGNTSTSGGSATVFLSSPVPGSASVTVQVMDSRAVAYVDFLPEGELGGVDDRVIDISGRWTGYSPELSLIEARDEVEVHWGRLTIEIAGTLQIDVEKQTLKAEKVTIRRGDTELTGEDVFFDLAAKRGVLRRFGEEKVERLFFDSVGLRPLETEWDLPIDAFRMDRRESGSWMLARSISLFLREKIVLRRAALWAQGQKVLSLPPYWIVGLPGYTGAANSQALGLSSDGGVAFEFPFFYRVTNQATGSVKIQNGASSSSVTPRDGWALGVEEEYRSATGAEGTVEFAGLPHSDWGAYWRDSRTIFGDGLSSFSFSSPEHRSLFSDWNLYDTLARGRLNVRAYYDAPADYETTYGLVGEWLSDPRGIGARNASYRYGFTMGGVQYYGDDSPVVLAELYSEMSLGRRSAGSRTMIFPTLSDSLAWDSGGYTRNRVRADLRLNHAFSSSFGVGLDYGLEFRQGDFEGEACLESLGFDLRANHGSKWLTYYNGTLDLTRDNLYSYATFDYYLNERWRWGLRHTYYSFDDSVYTDLELSLGRQLAGRELSLVYSTETGDVWLSLGGFTLH